MIWACRSFKTETRNSSLVAVTSRVGSSFTASVIEGLKYLLKAIFSIFFKLEVVVRSNGCNTCVMFFGTITDSVLCFHRTSDRLTVDSDLIASNIRKLFYHLVDLFFLKLLNIWHKDLLNKKDGIFSLLQCFYHLVDIFFLKLLNIWHKDMINKTDGIFSLLQCFSLYDK